MKFVPNYLILYLLGSLLLGVKNFIVHNTSIKYYNYISQALLCLLDPITYILVKCCSKHINKLFFEE